MKNRKQVMTVIYTAATLLSHFANSFIGGFLTTIGSDTIDWGVIYGNPHPFYMPFGSENFLITLIILCLLLLIYVFLIVTLIIELEHKRIYFIWGIILLLINLFSIVTTIAPLSM